MKRKVFLYFAIFVLSFGLIGCDSNSSLFDVVFGTGSNEMVGTMTLNEYDTKVNRLLTSIFTDAETIMSNSKYLGNGTGNIDEEYTLVQITIENLQENIDTIDKLAEPSRRTNDKAALILDLTDYKNALIQYALSLQEEDTTKMKEKADEVMIAIATLKGEWRTYTE